MEYTAGVNEVKLELTRLTGVNKVKLELRRLTGVNKVQLFHCYYRQ